MRVRVWTWTWLLVVILPLPAWAQLSAGMVASRTNGTAPLYVFFDGTTDAGVAHSDGDIVEFRDLQCDWDFGDSGAGNWSNSGLPKNQASGCIAAHVYESPGEYTATLRVRDEAGAERSVTTTINVSSPDATWSGADTVCFENGGGFAGCPSGALRISTNDYDAALTTHCDVNGNNARKRCLFRRGDRFTVGSSVQLWDGPILIGAFGSGPRPIIDGSGSGDGAFHVLGRQSPAETASDIRIVGLDYIGASGIQGNSHAVASCGSSATGGIDNVLLMDLRVRDMGAVLACAGSGNPREVPDRMALVSNTIEDADHRSIGFISATRTALLNNTSTDGGFRSSHVRFYFGRKIVIQHNRLTGNTGNASIKIAGIAAPATGSQVPDRNQQRYWLISDNRIDCDGGNCIGGYNDASQGGVAKIDYGVIERNDFRIANGSSNRVTDSCFDIAAWRNNVSRAGSDSANPFFDMNDAGGNCLYNRGGLRIYNNTFYATGDRPRYAVRLTSGNPDSIVRNNLYYTPGDTDTNRILSGSGGASSVASHNVQIRADVFTNSGAFDEARDFRIDVNAPAASSVIDAGFDLRGVSNDGEVIFVDYAQQCLTNGDVATRRDIGAFESGAAQCVSVSPGSGGSVLAAPVFLP